MSGVVQERNQDATVYVGNVDDKVLETLLWELFLQAGPVVNVHMPKDRITQAHQGYGFVEYMGEEDADYAIKIMNMIKVFGKPIRVNKAASHNKNLDVGANMFIGNLDPDIDEKLLYDTFSAFGVILQTPKIMRDPETGTSKGFAFVNFASFDASDAAIEAMNGQYLSNRPISVSYAFKKETKGERHGSAAERLLATNNPLTQMDRPHQLFADAPASALPPSIDTSQPPPGMAPPMGPPLMRPDGPPPPMNMIPGMRGPPPMMGGRPPMPPPPFSVNPMMGGPPPTGPPPSGPPPSGPPPMGPPPTGPPMMRPPPSGPPPSGPPRMGGPPPQGPPPGIRPPPGMPMPPMPGGFPPPPGVRPPSSMGMPPNMPPPPQSTAAGGRPMLPPRPMPPMHRGPPPQGMPPMGGPPHQMGGPPPSGPPMGMGGPPRPPWLQGPPRGPPMMRPPPPGMRGPPPRGWGPPPPRPPPPQN